MALCVHASVHTFDRPKLLNSIPLILSNFYNNEDDEMSFKQLLGMMIKCVLQNSQVQTSKVKVTTYAYTVLYLVSIKAETFN